MRRSLGKAMTGHATSHAVLLRPLRGDEGKDLEHRERDDQSRRKDRQTEPDEARGAVLMDPLAAPHFGAIGRLMAQLLASLARVGCLLSQHRVVLGVGGHRRTVLAWSDGSEAPDAALLRKSD